MRGSPLRQGRENECRLRLEADSLFSEPPAVFADTIPEIQKLTVDEKLILVGELWDEIAAGPDAFPPRADHLRLLRERQAHAREHPEKAVPWEIVRRRVLSSQ